MPLARVLALIAAVGLMAGGCGVSAPTRSIVMVSGRDDHGLLARPAVGLQRSPSDATVAGSASDGEFVRVLREDHAWLLVRTLASPAEDGWLNDHDLRDRALWVDRGIQVRFVDARVVDGRVEILVETVERGERAWVAAASLREVGARP